MVNCSIAGTTVLRPIRATRRTVGQRLKSHIPQADGQVLFNIFLFVKQKEKKYKKARRESIEGLKVKMGVDYLNQPLQRVSEARAATYYLETKASPKLADFPRYLAIFPRITKNNKFDIQFKTSFIRLYIILFFMLMMQFSFRDDLLFTEERKEKKKNSKVPFKVIYDVDHYGRIDFYHRGYIELDEGLALTFKRGLKIK